MSETQLTTKTIITYPCANVEPRNIHRASDARHERVALELKRIWWARRESNPRPIGYEPTALTPELRAHASAWYQFYSALFLGSLSDRVSGLVVKRVISTRG